MGREVVGREVGRNENNRTRRTQGQREGNGSERSPKATGSSRSHLHLGLDLEAEAFVPLWVWAVGDGSSPQLLLRGSGQPEAHKAVRLAHCSRKTRVEEKEVKLTRI